MAGHDVIVDEAFFFKLEIPQRYSSVIRSNFQKHLNYGLRQPEDSE